MITVFNAKNYAQQWFFDKAYESLKAKNQLSPAELNNKRFLSLEGYFAHMSNLVKIDPSFVLIPSDEKPFVIDANSRSITIPPDFNKCTGVAGDNMCEIVTFTIDRYFDYVDLANTNICIHWTAPSGEGISHITLIDYETIPGKIRFGWPLTSELTKKSGAINFAVKFFVKKSGTNEFTYVFNTLPNSINIRAGLTIESPQITEENIQNLFENFVQNSDNPSFPIPAPVYFNNDPGIDLKSQDKIDKTTNELTLTAQAVVSDNGVINYQWYFCSEATPKYPYFTFEQAPASYNQENEYYIFNENKNEYVLPEKQPGELDFDYRKYFIKTDLRVLDITPTTEGYEVKSEDYVEIIPTPTKRNGSEQYYIRTEEGGVPAYKLVITEELPSGEALYERVTSLKIINSEKKDITGLYWVGATNYVGVNTVKILDSEGNEINAFNQTPEVTSSKCYIPAPQNVIIPEDKNLKSDLFLTEDGDNMVATLSVTPNTDAGGPLRIYTWKKLTKKEDNTNPGQFVFDTTTTTVQSNSSNTLNIVQLPEIVEKDPNTGEITNTIPKENKTGWYQVDISSELNRTTKTASSTICRVLEPVKAPQLLEMSYRLLPRDGFPENPSEYFKESNWSVIYKDGEVKTDAFLKDENLGLGDIVRLRIKTDLDNEILNGNGLLSDSLTYKWYLIQPDGNKELTILDMDRNGNGLVIETTKGDGYKRLGGNEIDIRRIHPDGTPLRLYCEVTNTLNGQPASLTRGDYKTVFVIDPNTVATE